MDDKLKQILKIAKEISDKHFGFIPNSTLQKKYKKNTKFLVLDFRPDKEPSRPSRYPKS